MDQRVVVMDEDEVDEAFFHAPDALRVLPGLALSTTGHRGSLTQARVRGAESNHLLVLLDGVALNDPALGSEFNFGALDFAGVQRVEYLAGPQSAVWGSDALAGVSCISIRPLAETLAASRSVPARTAPWMPMSNSRGCRGTDMRRLPWAESSATARTPPRRATRTTASPTPPRTSTWVEFGIAGRRRSPHGSPTRMSTTTRPRDRATCPRMATGTPKAGARWFMARCVSGLPTTSRSWLTLASSRDRNRQYADGAFTDGTVGRRDAATLATNFHFDTAARQRDRRTRTGTHPTNGCRESLRRSQPAAADQWEEHRCRVPGRGRSLRLLGVGTCGL